MSTIKGPQTVSHKGNGGSGFVTMLLILTWLVIAAGFYAVKTGSLQPDSINPAVNDRISALESKITSLETRLAATEKKLNETSPVAPVEGQAVTPDASNAQPTTTPATPTSPITPSTPDANGTVTPPTEAPALVEPQAAPENKGGAAPTKPQSNNKDKHSPNQTAIFEKKNYI